MKMKLTPEQLNIILDALLVKMETMKNIKWGMPANVRVALADAIIDVQSTYTIIAQMIDDAQNVEGK